MEQRAEAVEFSSNEGQFAIPKPPRESQPLPNWVVERFIPFLQELSRARDLETIMENVRHAARELAGSDGATFVLRRGGNCYYADEDAISPLWKGQQFPMETCISGWVMLNKQPAVIEDIFADDRIPHDVYRKTFVKSLAMMPIRTVDPLGAIGVYWAERFLLGNDTLKLLQMLADSISVAMENIQVYGELEHRVAERTAELSAANKALESEIARRKRTEGKLRLYAERLKAGNEDLKEFAYVASHDLQEPLRKVQMFSQMLADRYQNALDDKARDAIARMNGAAGRMQHLITSLLKYSRASSADLTFEKVDLNRVVSEVLEDLEARIKDANGRVEIEPLPMIDADSVQMRQLFQNLIGNGLKFHKHGAAFVRIGLEHSDEQSVRVRVEDNGIGFEQQYADRIFKPFQRLVNRSQFEGSGIGLAVCRKIAERHGGTISAQGAPGQGATFTVELPVSQAKGRQN